jgi:sensor histidine kinase YesM
MKTKNLIFLFILLPFSLFSQVNLNKLSWEGSRTSKNFKISYLNNQYDNFYCFENNYIKILGKTKQGIQKIKFEDSKILKISDSIYCIIPCNIGDHKNLIINNDSLNYAVEEIPANKFSIKFSKSTSPFSNCISKDDFFKSDSLIVSFNSKKYKITNFELNFSGIQNGITRALTCNCNGVFNDNFKKIFKENIFENSKIKIVNVKIQLSNNKEVTLPPAEITVIDNYKNEFIRRTVSFEPFTYDLNLLKTDLRIKLTGKPSKTEKDAITEYANELNSILETIKVKIVETQPNLTIVFDTINNDSIIKNTEIKYIDYGIYKSEDGNIFFPFQKKCVLYVNTKIGEKYRIINLKKNILSMLGIFKNAENVVEKEFSIFHYNDNLTSYDKYMLKTLYSSDGEYKAQRILHKDFDDPDRNSIYLLILILSICLLFVFSEIYNYYGINVFISKIKISILKRIIESIILAQIPTLAILVLLLENFLGGNFHEIYLLSNFELFFIPFTVFAGVLFFWLDFLLSKIKRNWIVVILNLFLSFFCIWLAYQLVFLFYSPEIVTFKMVDWEILIIPFLIALYRLYARSQTNKITSLLKEKELELTKQKELKLKSDLNALQARINPHFLYNALNSLASLAHIDAGRTENMALSLSKLFRYNINKEDEHFSKIIDEIEMTNIYLDIEKNRFEEKLEYTINIEEKLNDFEIPKFVLQPLAENAVKHGISKIVEKGIIKINIFEQNQKVIIEICDNGPNFPDGLTSGYGLQNTYEKFKLLYKKPFDIEFFNKPEKKLMITLTK